MCPDCPEDDDDTDDNDEQSIMEDDMTHGDIKKGGVVGGAELLSKKISFNKQLLEKHNKTFFCLLALSKYIFDVVHTARIKQFCFSIINKH